MGLRADRGAEGPGRRRARAAVRPSATRSPTRRCTTSSRTTPSVTFTSASGEACRLEADVVVGCDGSFGPSRGAVPSPPTWERTYPYSWLGILADVAPSTDELIYAWHPEGSRCTRCGRRRCRGSTCRSPTTPRSTTGPTTGSGTVWPPGSATARTAGRWRPDRSPTARCCRCARSCRPRCGTADSSSPATPRTSSRRPAPRGSTSPSPTSRSSRPRWWPGCGKDDPSLADAYADTAVRRVWRCTHFSWWMTTMLHADRRPVRRAAPALPAPLGHLQRGRRHRPRRELRRVADRILRSARGMFWFRWKTLSGSTASLSAVSLANFAGE